MPSVRVSSAPSIEPISLVDAKAHMNITDDTDDDTYITTLITAARKYGESRQCRTYINTTLVWKLEGFPRQIHSTAERIRVLYVPRAPLSSVSSITYIDNDGNSQTWASSKYTVDTDTEPGRIEPAFGEAWPSTRNIFNAVTVTYIAGYGSSKSDVPETTRQAILLMVEHLYGFREPFVPGTPIREIPLTINALFDLDNLSEFG